MRIVTCLLVVTVVAGASSAARADISQFSEALGIFQEVVSTVQSFEDSSSEGGYYAEDGTYYDEDGYDSEGYDEDGWDAEGYDREGNHWEDDE